MTLPVIFHELAESELNEAAEYYAQARLGLGEAFLTEVQGAVNALAATPLAGQTVEGAFAGGSCGASRTASPAAPRSR